MMKNPEGDLYKACFNALGDLGKGIGAGIMFDAAMREKFEELTVGQNVV
jgi:hypothetical protein